MIDLHVHSSFSDGLYSPKIIIETAIHSNLTEIGFSDHYWTSKTNSVSASLLDEYLDTLDRLIEQYRSHITIRKGLEIDLNSVFISGTQMPSESALLRLDYLLFEYCSDRPMSGIPLKHALELRKSVAIPVGLAHTDLLQQFPRHDLPVLLATLAESGTFIECNDSYERQNETTPYYQYLQDHLSAVRQSGVVLSCGSDMHDDLSILGAERANTWISVHSLKSQLVKFG